MSAGRPARLAGPRRSFGGTIRMSRFAVCAAALSVACASAQKPAPAPRLNRWGKPWKEGIAIPAWVETIPESGQGKLVTVGYSPPSFWPQDAIDAAASDARGKLALALVSHVEELGIDSATGTSNGGATINKEASDVVMPNSLLEATWTDENGERSDPGGVWALASLEMDSIRGRGPAGAVRPAGTVRPASTAGGRSGPAWLDHLPASTAKVYAAGYSGPTYHPDDAKRYASD